MEAFEILGIVPEQITQIVLTHVHPDHYGMAGWLEQQISPQAVVRMSDRSVEMARFVWQEPVRWEAEAKGYLQEVGLPQELQMRLMADMRLMRTRVQPFPENVQTICPGAYVELGGRQFKSIATPGHSDDHLVYWEAQEKLLFCGDQVLLRITPNVGRWPGTSPGVLRRFLHSLHHLKALDVQQAFPGHYESIHTFGERIDELMLHHQYRLQATCQAVSSEEGITVYETARKIFPFEQFTSHEVRFAVAEAYAHLEYLEEEGWVYSTCRDGVRYYFPSSDSFSNSLAAVIKSSLSACNS